MMRLTHDAIGGIFLVVIAIAFAIGASHFQFGTLFRMGPGFYPILVSAVLGTIGLALTISGLRQSPQAEAAEGDIEVDLRSAVAVLGSVIAFAFALERTGLVVSTFLLVGIASLAERKKNIVRTLVLAVCLAAVAVAIFIYGLGLNIPLWKWPL